MAQASDEFQFPTGWNSTNFWVLVDVADDLFQFPTGWNSTEFVRYCDAEIAKGFNSQRDGILRRAKRHSTTS